MRGRLTVNDELLDIREVASLFGVCPRTVERLPDLPYYKLGRCRRYQRGDVLDYLKKVRVAL